MYISSYYKYTFLLQYSVKSSGKSLTVKVNHLQNKRLAIETVIVSIKS